MKILSGNYFNPKLQNYNNKNYGLELKNQLKHDTVCFKALDLLDLPEHEIIEQVKNSINNENFIGQGTEAEVYRIKNTNYCVKIPHQLKDKCKSNFSKELTQADKINHIKAKFPYGIVIMDYFEGVTPKEYRENNYYRNIFQEKISKFPLKSYTELLHQIAEGYKNKMLFDFSSGNLIVNFEHQKLTAIDFYDTKYSPKTIKPLCQIYSVLTSHGAKQEIGKKLYDKVVDAGLNEFYPNNTPCMDVELFDFLNLAITKNNDFKFITDYTTQDQNNFLKLQTKIYQTAKALKEIKKEELTNKTLAAPLLDKINELKNLLKKVH